MTDSTLWLFYRIFDPSYSSIVIHGNRVMIRGFLKDREEQLKGKDNYVNEAAGRCSWNQ
jgi:hypothetical protein